MKSLLLLLVPVLMLSCSTRVCNDPEPYLADKLVFGTFYGECAGNCVNLYQLDKAALYKDDSAWYPSISWTYVFAPTRLLPKDKYEMAKSLLRAIPRELFTTSNVTYGAPDSHDQGGMYIIVERGTEKRRFQIDHDNTTDQSAEIVAFKQKVAEVMKELR